MTVVLSKVWERGRDEIINGFHNYVSEKGGCVNLDQKEGFETLDDEGAKITYTYKSLRIDDEGNLLVKYDADGYSRICLFKDEEEDVVFLSMNEIYEIMERV